MIAAAASSGAEYIATDSASVGADMRAMSEAIAGAVAMRKPAEVKKMEKAEMVSIRRRRARRRLGMGDAEFKVSNTFALYVNKSA